MRAMRSGSAAPGSASSPRSGTGSTPRAIRSTTSAPVRLRAHSRPEASSRGERGSSSANQVERVASSPGFARASAGASRLRHLAQPCPASAGTGRRYRRRQRPSLVLLDVMMPGVDGWNVAEQLASDAQTRDIPVVFLSARAAPEDRLRAQELGAVGYVVKPFDPLELAGTVREVLDRVAKGERDQLNRDLSSNG
ncbi:MAG TPA: response regulator [Gaiellaceae bacterium]|nr:response regulator [Gaiellaceae bacterium]